MQTPVFGRRSLSPVQVGFRLLRFNDAKVMPDEKLNRIYFLDTDVKTALHSFELVEVAS